MKDKPKNYCKGCAARDEINKRLAERIDELENRKPKEKAAAVGKSETPGC